MTDQVRLSSLFRGIVRAQPPLAKTITLDGLYVFILTRGQLYFTQVEGVDMVPTLMEPGDVLALPPAGRWNPGNARGDSRTVFATHFKALAGESPMAYVSR